MFGEPPLPDRDRAGRRAPRPHRHGALARAVVAGAGSAGADGPRREQRRWRCRRRPICAHGSATTRRPSGGCTSTTATTVGDYNPCFPPYTLELDERRRRGCARHRGVLRQLRGPPGIVHGGFLAVFFDCVLQELNCVARARGEDRRAVDAVPATDAVADAAHLPRRARRRRPAHHRARRAVPRRRAALRSASPRGEGRPRALPAVSARRP